MGPQGIAYAGLAVRGHSVYANKLAAAGGRLVVSHDDGDHFERRPTYALLPCPVQPQEGGVVWAWCRGGMFMHLARSTDAGRSFDRLAALADCTGPDPATDGWRAMALVAASPTRLVLAPGPHARETCVLVSNDAGGTWSHADVNLPGRSYVDRIKFVSSDVGFGIAYTRHGVADRLLRTTDGGATWRTAAYNGRISPTTD